MSSFKRLYKEENLEKFKDIIYNLSKEIEIRENKLPEIKSLLEKINKEIDINNLKKLLTDSNYIINSSLIQLDFMR